MQQLLERADVSELQEATGMSVDDIRNLEFLSGDEVAKMSAEEKQQRVEVVSSLMAVHGGSQGFGEAQ